APRRVGDPAHRERPLASHGPRGPRAGPQPDRRPPARPHARPGRTPRPLKEEKDEQAMTTAATRHGQARRYVENRHIEYIPASARHGKPWQQFFFWFGGNVNVFNVVLGGVTVTIGLTFWWAVLAITVGTVIGALLIAAHAAQGPKLGVPQTIQTRAQLGYYGAAFMFVAVLALNIGFVAAELVIQA